MKSNHFKKPFIIVLAVIVVLFLAGLIGTPYLIDLGLERWIASQGPEIGEVENIDFNPFSGRLSMLAIYPFRCTCKCPIMESVI